MGTPFLGQRALLHHPLCSIPGAAIVSRVRDDGTVNLCVLRDNGETDKRTAVPVDEPQVKDGFYCTLEPDLKEELDVAHLAIGALSDKVDALGDALDKLSAPKATFSIQPPPVAPPDAPVPVPHVTVVRSVTPEHIPDGN